MTGRLRFFPLLHGVVLIVGLVAPAAAAPPVTVTVREPNGIERQHWPLTFSVPWPRGALRKGEAVAVHEDGGAALPVQSRVLSAWPDGSTRWLLVDTQVDLRPSQERHLRVEHGTPGHARATLTVTSGAERIDVDTGALRFSVPRTHFGLLEGLHPAGEKRPFSGAVESVLVAGERRGEAQKPTDVRILEQGPLRTRIALAGTYGNGFDYEIRLDAYAGQPFVRILHTFINRHPTPVISVPRIAIEVPLGELKPGTWRAGVVHARMRSDAIPDDGVHLVQRDNSTAEIGGDGEPLQLAGWVELGGSRANLGIAARWFWQEYPQSFDVHRDHVDYNLWAPEADPANIGVGAAKTHEFALWIAGSRHLPPGVGAALTEPLVGVVDPQAIAASGALPDAVAAREPGARFIRKAADGAQRYLKRNEQEQWNDCGRVHCTEPGLERVRTGAFGMWNWGDWNFRGYQDTVKGTDSWGNLEYDTTEVLALTYAATGDPALFDAMAAAARHYADVDVIHASPSRPEWVGMNHPKNPLHFSFQLGGPDLGHTWAQGLVDYYYLTGDERGLSAARGIADYLVGRLRGPLRGNPRQWGWPQIALLAVHQATGETPYLDAARRYASGGMAAHPPGGTNQWKLGILADALAHTHAASNDEAIRTWLQSYAAAIMEHPAKPDTRAFPAVAYVGRLTDNAAMRDAALERARQLDLGSWGKPFTVNGRLGFRIFSLLQ
ncbi:MAG TPA: beta-L-arabinofuranosidase domain-containing protein [Candidatus Dormibacteraeota bacterium]|nr:beta-L-arabinofuranosidase domain-containing protein [Candidatus Dormibacteraeota bacterium]